MGKVTQRDKQENWAILVCRRERENWDASELRCCFSFSVPENPPANVTAKLNGTEVLVMWEQPSGKLNGQLQGYMVEYSTPATQQVRNTFTVNKVAKFTNAWRKCQFFLIMTDRFFSFRLSSIPDWALSSQSICLSPCPMSLSECVPIQGRVKDPGHPFRLWHSTFLVSNKIVIHCNRCD